MNKLRSLLIRTLLLSALIGCAAPGFAQESTLRIGVDASDINTLDPHRTAVSEEKGLIGLIFGGLVRFLPGSADPEKIEGDLAESWTASPDGLTWTFKLRRGVQFHRNYGEVSSEDVVYSLTRAADPKRSSFSSTFEPIREVVAVDPYTVRIQLKTAVPSLLGLVANFHGGMIVSRKADQELKDAFKLRPVGFGPFEFAEYQKSREVVLKANERYFRGKPKIDRVVYRFFPSEAVRGLAFATGELDLVAGQRDQRWLQRARLWAPPKDQSAVKVDVFGPGEFRTLMMNRRIKPLDDPRVREALARAVDVQELIRFVGPEIVKSGRSVVPPGYAGEVDVGPKFPFDLAKAKALLAEAGHPNGINLKVVVSSVAPQLSVMEVVQRQLKRAGINLTMDVVEHATYHAQIRKDLSAIVFYGAARFPVADSYLTEFYHSRSEIGAPTQVTNFSHCNAADKEIDAARSSPNSTARNSLWRVAQVKINADLCAIPLFDLQQVWARRGALDYGVPLEGSMNLLPPINEKSTLRK